jgi:hypothetical protein
MERIVTWARENPQFAGLSFGATILIIVFTVLATSMIKSEVSIRPLIWFGGFFAIVAAPQAFIHFMDGWVLRTAASPAANDRAEPERVSTTVLKPVPWPVVFGPKADPDLITDAKHGLSQILGDAVEAKLSFNADGESALAARFTSPAAAEAARDAYGNFFAFADVRGSDAGGWTARRHAGQGEWVHLVTAGPELYAWTGAGREQVVGNRVRALGPLDDSGPGIASPNSAQTNPRLLSHRLRARPVFMTVFVSLNLVAAVLWFFKGSAWSARIDPDQVAWAASKEDLQASLLRQQKSDIPTEATLQPDGSLAIDWRYADARWFDLMKVHQIKRAHRLVLTFDEADRTVRVREYISAFDASLGADGLRLAWKAQTGIQFFQFEKRRVVGVQLGTNGVPTGDLSQSYTFNLQSLKAPIIEKVTQAGWRWQPLTWNAPAGLRWLTE